MVEKGLGGASFLFQKHGARSLWNLLAGNSKLELVSLAAKTASADGRPMRFDIFNFAFMKVNAAACGLPHCMPKWIGIVDENARSLDVESRDRISACSWRCTLTLFLSVGCLLCSHVFFLQVCRGGAYLLVLHDDNEQW